MQPLQLSKLQFIFSKPFYFDVELEIGDLGLVHMI